MGDACESYRKKTDFREERSLEAESASLSIFIVVVEIAKSNSDLSFELEYYIACFESNQSMHGVSGITKVKTAGG